MADYDPNDYEQDYDENLEARDIFLIQHIKPTPTPIIKSITYPENTYLYELLALFSGCDLVCKLQINDEELIQDVKSGVKQDIQIGQVGSNQECQITLEFSNINEDASLSYLSISVIEMLSIPVKVSDIFVKQHPQQGFTICLDFTDALMVAVGNNEIISKKVQIKNPASQVDTVTKSSVNYVWKQDVLYCVLTAGMPYYIRIKYDIEDQSVDWSPWLKIMPKRKMSL